MILISVLTAPLSDVPSIGSMTSGPLCRGDEEVSTGDRRSPLGFVGLLFCMSLASTCASDGSTSGPLAPESGLTYLFLSSGLLFGSSVVVVVVVVVPAAVVVVVVVVVV